MFFFVIDEFLEHAVPFFGLVVVSIVVVGIVGIVSFENDTEICKEFKTMGIVAQWVVDFGILLLRFASMSFLLIFYWFYTFEFIVVIFIDIANVQFLAFLASPMIR